MLNRARHGTYLKKRTVHMYQAANGRHSAELINWMNVLHVKVIETEASLRSAIFAYY